ncbi:MAG TPA: PEGA domain-containing protein [Terriglobia bacterium]|nr:PEGA domain-containing protein [Terriglobia bacterium]HVB29417.1 PEGA domain-containing protein [Terriglobia bacterium]
MANRLRLVSVVALSFIASAALAYGQSTGFAGGLVAGPHSSSVTLALPLGQASAEAYAFAGGAYPQSSAQQNESGAQGQSQGGNQSPKANGNPNQDQNKQGQAKEEAPPEKPHYLTYTVKKKSIQEQAKSGKTLDVDFKSVPAGAAITVDGYFLGNTPTTAKLPLGKHLISITKWGYRSWEQELDVTGGKSLSVNPTMSKDW